MFLLYCIIALFIVFLLHHCTFCCIWLSHMFRLRLLFRPMLLYIHFLAIQLFSCKYVTIKLSWVVVDDLRWPLTTLNHLNFYILRCPMHLRNWWSQKLQIWCKGWMCKSQPTDDKLSRLGRGQVTWPIINFWGSNHITGTAEPKVVKFCTWVGYSNSSNRITYHPQKGRGYGHLTILKFGRLPWCSESLRFVSDSWATCVYGYCKLI